MRTALVHEAYLRMIDDIRRHLEGLPVRPRPEQAQIGHGSCAAKEIMKMTHSLTSVTTARGAKLLPRMTISTCLLLTAIALPSCSDKVTDIGEKCPPNCPPPMLEVGDPASFSLGGLKFEVFPDGSVRNGQRINDPAGNNVFLFFLTGIWIGAEVSGQSRGNLAWSGGHDGLSNYLTASGGSDSTARPLGPFVNTNEHLQNPDLDWPEGAPVDAMGLPRVYGDEMIWSSVVSDTTDRVEEFSLPLLDLQVNQSFCAVQEEGLENVIFCRWDVTNQSDLPWENVHVGFYSDTDLGFGNTGAGTNRAGYSASDGLSYVYSRTATGAQYAAGIAFVVTPAENAPTHHTTSHRILRKNSLAPIEFSEFGFDRPEQILWALQGLSNDREPMVDPTTDKATAYAYSGDPVAGEGWIDDSLSDMRNMIGSGAFDLAPGETETVIGVWIHGQGNDLRSAIDRVRSTLVDARREAHRIVQ